MEAVLATVVRILEFIIAFGLLVFLHEMGHYLMAKLFNIEVEEFGFGFPPRLVKLFQFRETEFTLNLIPFGAFVRPKGEADPNVAGGLGAAGPWARLGVLIGGSAMNLITGVVIFSLVFARIGVPDPSLVAIAEVVPGTPAAEAGIQVDDIVVSVNGEPVDSSTELAQLIRANAGKETILVLQRGEQTLQVSAVPRADPPPNQGALGIVMGNPYRQTSNVFELLSFSGQLAYTQIRSLITLPFQMLRGEVSPEEGRVVGPKGIYDIYQSARTQDAEEVQQEQQPRAVLGLNTLYLLGAISIALGFTNLLPLPALDGGRILFVLPEILFRRRVPARYENMVHLIGFALLILLMIYVTTQDIINPVTLP